PPGPGIQISGDHRAGGRRAKTLLPAHGRGHAERVLGQGKQWPPPLRFEAEKINKCFPVADRWPSSWVCSTADGSTNATSLESTLLLSSDGRAVRPLPIRALALPVSVLTHLLFGTHMCDGCGLAACRHRGLLYRDGLTGSVRQ